jgi:hypothetical protein
MAREMPQGPMVKVAESVLKKVEKDNFDGITSADLLAFFVSQEIRFGEATLRKWVQLGLLPRSVRVGTKGKHQGSKGKYPVRVLRQILRIKELMAKNLTIEDIQKQFLFVRGDIEQLEQTLEQIFGTLDRMAGDRSGTSVRAVSADIGRAHTQAKDLVERLEKIERRMMAEAEAARTEAAAS